MISVFGIPVEGFIHLFGYGVIGLFVGGFVMISTYFISTLFQKELLPEINTVIAMYIYLAFYVVFLIVGMYKLVENLL